MFLTKDIFFYKCKHGPSTSVLSVFQKRENGLLTGLRDTKPTKQKHHFFQNNSTVVQISFI